MDLLTEKRLVRVLFQAHLECPDSVISITQRGRPPAYSPVPTPLALQLRTQPRAWCGSWRHVDLCLLSLEIEHHVAL